MAPRLRLNCSWNQEQQLHYSQLQMSAGSSHEPVICWHQFVDLGSCCPLGYCSNQVRGSLCCRICLFHSQSLGLFYHLGTHFISKEAHSRLVLVEVLGGGVAGLNQQTRYARTFPSLILCLYVSCVCHQTSFYL